MNQDNFFARINESFQELTGKQKLLAQYLMNHYKQAAYMSCLDLGQMVGASDATVIRFAQRIGYRNYLELSDELKTYVVRHATPAEKLSGYGKLDFRGSLPEVCQRHISVLQSTMEQIPSERIEQLADEILESDRILVCGFEGLSGLAEYLTHHLQRLGHKAQAIKELPFSAEGFGPSERVQEDSKELLLIMDFTPILRGSVECGTFFKERGARIWSLSDSLESGLTAVAHEHIFLNPVDPLSYNLDVFPGVLAFSQSLFITCGRKRPEETKEALEALTRYYAENQVLEDK